MLDARATDGGGDAEDAARAAGLTYVAETSRGFTRRRHGAGFRYTAPDGSKAEAAAVERIRKLAIPPAWSDVWICAKPNGHIQATGRDAKNRKQYRYHPEFRVLRESAKYEHIMAFAQILPTIRAKVAKDMSRPGLGREKVLATVVHLLETTLIRVGNGDYVRQNRSYGLTTLLDRHVVVDGSTLRFNFKGKSGKVWRLGVKDRRIAKVVRACQELPGQDLFQYVDGDTTHNVSSADVNAYLKEISGENVTAKDFRTWAGTVLAALALREFEAFDSKARAKKNVKAAIERVAARLGNTPTICRKCYIHPEILDTYAEGSFLLEVKEEVESELREELGRLLPEEAAVLSLLEMRLQRALGDSVSGKVALDDAGTSRPVRRQARARRPSRKPAPQMSAVPST